MSQGNRMAGIADPYWYEWGIGLLKVVDMLNPDSGIEAVAFQKNGAKGWDDVVVRFDSGHHDYYQVKHSRPRSNLTFSDLVAKSEDGTSLLGSLSSAWLDMGLCGSDASCVLITNRNAGTHGGTSKDGTIYPPLGEFISHLNDEVVSATSVADMHIPDSWLDAWRVWLAEMVALTDVEKFSFLQALNISTNAPQLEEMEGSLIESLATSFVVTERQAASLLPNLRSALAKWTTSLRGTDEWVTAEDVMESLAGLDPNIFGACDVPTPTPFFPSRQTSVDSVTSLLVSDETHRIVFLEADPGAGKTSVVSRLVNQRASDFSSLVVDIRYYAYRPITPEAPTLPADADLSASPRSLWYSLLSQVRERLRGRLRELTVPIRNDFLSPEEAREHVLRLSAVLGKEKDTPFIIVIDGIDHAARAHRKGLASLLDSLPTPEGIPGTVRILIAGQPASGYPEYPNWLRIPNDLVALAHLGPVEINDIQLLLSHSAATIPSKDWEHASRIIQDVAEGNTLAVVFAVAETEYCRNLNELQERLASRQLHAGVHAYYQAIWNTAMPVSPKGIAPYLSSVLCILRERVTGQMMHGAFPDWEKTAPEWDAFLKSLEPLVVRDEEGFRVRHNDIRVFLERELREDETALKQVASLLADYYAGPSADPRFRHESLFSLLGLAGRDGEKGCIFCSAWVLDAAAHGQTIPNIYQEAEEAFQAIPLLKDWEAALEVACGGLTLAKLSDCIDAVPDLLDSACVNPNPLPPCLETERFVLPFNRWDDSTVRQVLHDAAMLAEGNAGDRAEGLLRNWLGTLTPSHLVSAVAGLTDERGMRGGPSLGRTADSLLEEWGRLAFTLDIVTDRGKPRDDLGRNATYFFEKGWVTACVRTSDQNAAWTALQTFEPHYVGTFEVAIQEAAKGGAWALVGDLLRMMGDSRDRLSTDFCITAAYWALKSLGPDAAKEWLEILPEARTGQLGDIRIETPLMISVAKAIGWTEYHRDASAIACELADAITSSGSHVRDRSALLVPLRAASMIGLIERMLSKGDSSGAAALVQASDVKSVIELLWNNRQSLGYREFLGNAFDLTFDLIALCQRIGNAHEDMVVSLSRSEAKRFTVDRRMPVLWEILRSVGQKELLRPWAEHWIGEDGAVWSGVDYSERSEIVHDLSRLAREEGWIDIAAAAERRLRDHVIGYSSHKEYGFQGPLDWVRELTEGAPETWQAEGLELLDICRECDDQGGDNRLSSEIENTVATAAFRCGPEGAWAFFSCIDPDVERYWIQTVRGNLVAASRQVISEHTVTEEADVLALWCCAIGLSRWANKYQAQSITSLRDSILAAVPAERKQEFSDRMTKLTPGEMAREEYDKDRPSSESTDDETLSGTNDFEADDAVSELIEKAEAGHEPSLAEIAELAIQVAQKNPLNRAEIMTKLFGLVDVNRSYSASWDYWGRKHPLRELIPVIRDDEVWELIRAAVRGLGEPYWALSVPRNVLLICLFNAVNQGTENLQKGTECVFRMHRLWAGMSEQKAANEPYLAEDSPVSSWSHFAALVLRRLLLADSAETVSAALRGLSVLADVNPEILPDIFDQSEERTQSWLLHAAELWAVRHPQAMGPLLQDLWAQKNDLGLQQRIQLWICMQALARSVDGIEISGSFMPAPARTHEEPSTILTEPKLLMRMAPKMQGSTRLANACSAAENWLNRIEIITGHDTSELESKIAEALDAKTRANDEGQSQGDRKHFGSEEGDMLITGGIDDVLYAALDVELSGPAWGERNAEDIALAVTHGDEPWVVRRSPHPSPPALQWPDETELDEWLSSGAAGGDMLSRLRLMAAESSLDDGKKVLGSYVSIFTSHHDFEMWHWLETVPEGDYSPKKTPLCPSGRCFQFFLNDRFEPRQEVREPLVFFSRSFLCLSFGTLAVIPSRALQEGLA